MEKLAALVREQIPSMGKLAALVQEQIPDVGKLAALVREQILSVGKLPAQRRNKFLVWESFLLHSDKLSTVKETLTHSRLQISTYPKKQ
ncbi:MAG: hypothetical protein EAZ53_11030 [Bacteroidetes bacterium]|nr:MAG: hypothetical protein EAZ53_11030 [Bacteroidota bacterium]